MINSYLQSGEIDTFKMANSLLKGSSRSTLEKSFEEVLEEKVNEVAEKAKEKIEELANESTLSKKKKTKNNLNNDLSNINQLFQNINKRSSGEIQNTYLLLDKFKESRKTEEEKDFLDKSPREQVLNNANNVVGRPLIEPVYDQGPKRRMTKAQLLENWEKYAPTVTEDVTKKAVRLDIPLLNDVQALVLRLHPDKSISASLLGSQAMAELVKQNKDKLDRNLKHHHLSLREFNTYRSELELSKDSGTRKRKRQGKQDKKLEVDLI